MIRYTIDRLLKAIGVTVESFPEELRATLLTGVSTDTRSVRPGDVFFGIRGEKFDGSRFAGQALDAGAVLAVVNAGAENIPAKGPVARVRDTVQALGMAARDYRSRFEGTVFAVTGTTGKTTVKEMLLAVLAARFRVHGTFGNFNNHIGLPLSIFGLNARHECAVFELGMSAPGEIACLTDIARPDIGIILNAGPGHMEFFQNIEAVADAKTELLRALPSVGTAVMNGDDALLRARESGALCRVARFGLGSRCEYQAKDVTLLSNGCASFRVEGHPVRLRVPGVHNVYNALAAWAAGRLMRIGKSEIAAALEAFQAPKMRMRTVDVNGVHYIDDSYNANPLSMRAAADVLGSMEIPEGGRLIAVLGDMLELGSVTHAAHREIGSMFGGLRPAALCLVGEQAQVYREGALNAGLDMSVISAFGSAEEAREFIEELKRPGDLIFVKGSRALGMEKIIAESNGER